MTDLTAMFLFGVIVLLILRVKDLFTLRQDRQGPDPMGRDKDTTGWAPDSWDFDN